MRTYGLLKRLLLYAAGIVLFYVFAVVGVAVTLPAVATLVIGEEFTGQYKVIAKGDGRFRFKDRCNTHAIHLRSSLPGSLDTKVCLGEEAWSAVKVGDVLTIKGHQSQFGILLEEYWPARPPS